VSADRPIVEIRTPNAVAVMKALDEMPEVEDSSLFGTAVHAVLRPGAPDGRFVVERLAGRNLEVLSVERVPPSLEDVFLDVVEKAAR